MVPIPWCTWAGRKKALLLAGRIKESPKEGRGRKNQTGSADRCGKARAPAGGGNIWFHRFFYKNTWKCEKKVSETEIPSRPANSQSGSCVNNGRDNSLCPIFGRNDLRTRFPHRIHTFYLQVTQCAILLSENCPCRSPYRSLLTCTTFIPFIVLNEKESSFSVIRLPKNWLQSSDFCIVVPLPYC